MNNIVPLNNELHKSLKINDTNDFTHFKDQHLIPVTVHDFIPLSSEFAIAFVKNAETGQFTPAALMGIKTELNLYCQQGDWPANVLPSAFRNAPLSLAKNDEQDENCFVCIDTNSPLVSETQGQALFDETGQQSDYLKNRTEHLLKVAESVEQTQAISQYFASKKLLVNKPLTINLANDQKLSINGLYVINEQALNALSSEEFLDLREKGLLPLIYAQLASMQQISRLAKKQIAFDNK